MLSENDRAVESIRNSASELLLTFKSKLEQLQGNYEITELLIRKGYDSEKCVREAVKFFGADEVSYLAVDGTEYEDARLDMLVFYAGAFAYRGVTRFANNGQIISEPPSSPSDSSSLSCAIPLSEEYSSAVFGEIREGGVEFDPSKVSDSLMRLSEYYKVYLALRNDPELKILLMDRTVSGDIAHISWRLREHIRDGASVLMGFHTNWGKITRTDLELGRMLIDNRQLGIPAPRSQFLKFAAMSLLMEQGPLGIEQIVKELGANIERKTKIEKEIRDEMFKEAFVEGNEPHMFEVRDTAMHYWERLLEGTEFFVRHIFSEKIESDHPLKLADKKSHVEKWIRCEDIDYFTLLLIISILKTCWEKNILLLGIVKDSAAGEMVRTVIPILEKAGLLNQSKPLVKFESDTMLLQANSIVNARSLMCPWRTFEYDVCFRTINLDSKEVSSSNWECRVQGAFNNVIAAERTFVKAYFQLWNSEDNPSVRSHVFLYDRPCYPKYDNIRELTLKNLDNGVEEEIVPSLHYNSDSPISELVIAILDSMGREAIPEALGHNYPLFLADKRAKVAYDQASKGCVAAVDLEITKAKLDQQTLFQGKYRKLRAGLESNRRKSRKQS